jgi:hypothetical protein
MISKYNSFTLDSLLEKAINESFLYYSPNVRKALNRIKSNDIATDLLGSEGTDVKPDMTFIDLGKEGYFSFITMKNAKPLILAKYPSQDFSVNIDTKPMADPESYSNDLHEYDMITGSNLGTGIFTKSRNEVGLGRFVNKLFPGKYNSKQVEDFVNSFKASLEKAGERFELVEGEDIEFWYNSDNYKEISGNLGNSCMARKRNLFSIYTENPEVCKMLILKEDDKILGRALVWKLESINIVKDQDPGFFMDRQYTIKDSDIQKFKNYAKEQGWSYKSSNNHHSFGTINLNGVDKNVDMVVSVKVKDYNKYPYMDTFRRYNPDTGLLYNDDERDKEEYEGQYILEDTTGGYEEIESGVWSEWYDTRINGEEAIWSEPLDSYIYSDSSVRVDRGNSRRHGWYPDDYDDIFYDEDHDEYFHDDNGVYSEIEGRTLYDETAVLVVTEIFDDGDVPSSSHQYMYEGSREIVQIDDNSTWYKKITDKIHGFRDWRDYDYISEKLLIEDYEGNYIPKKFAIETYKITEPRDNSVDITGIKYLTKVDSLGLGYNIDEYESRTIDWFSYTLEISDFTDILLERLTKLIIRYIDVLNDTGQLQFKFKDLNEQEYRDKVSMNLALCQDRVEHLEEGTWE